MQQIKGENLGILSEDDCLADGRSDCSIRGSHDIHECRCVNSSVGMDCRDCSDSLSPVSTTTAAQLPPRSLSSSPLTSTYGHSTGARTHPCTCGIRLPRYNMSRIRTENVSWHNTAQTATFSYGADLSDTNPRVYGCMGCVIGYQFFRRQASVWHPARIDRRIFTQGWTLMNWIPLNRSIR